MDKKAQDEKSKMEEGLKAQNSTPEQPQRYAEPQAEERSQPVDDEPTEFKKNAEMDNIKHKTKPKVKLFPVKLLKNYRPISDEAQIQDKNGTYRPLSDEEAQKVQAGAHISLPVEEAQSVIKNKIAERNDPVA
jgi:hypothetical protein